MPKTEEEDEEALTPQGDESDDEWERVPSPSAKGADDDEWEKVETSPEETKPPITEKDLPGMTQKGLATANLRKLPFTPPTRFEKERPGDMGGEIAQGLGTLGRQAKGIAQSLVAPEMKGYQAFKQAKESGQGKGAALGYGVARGILAAAPGDPYGQAEEILHTPRDYAERRAGGKGQEGNVEGYNPIYSALAPTAAQATQVDLPTMEAAARTGNVAGVRAEMGLPMAEAIGGPLAHEIGQIPAIKNAPGKVLNALHNPMTLGLTPEQLITKGVRPRQRATGWDAAVNNPDVQRAIVDYHKADPIRSLDDMKDAVPEMKEKLWDGKVQPALDRQGPRPMDKEMKAVAQDVRDAITPTMREFNPTGVEQLEKLAGQLERSRTVAEASDLQKYANAQLQSYFDKYPTARRSALATHPDVLGWEVARRSLRENLIKVMEGAGETEAAPARKAYGDLTTIEKELERRKNPNDRSSNTSLSRLLGWISAIPTLGVGAAVGELAHHLNKPDVNIRRGIAGLNPPEAAPFTPPPAFVPPPTPPAPPPPGAGLGGPFEIERPPGGGPGATGGMWQQQVGQPPPLESGAPRSPFQEPIGPQPGPPEPITPPIQGEQQRLPMPETPQEAPLWNLEPINAPRNVPELQQLPGAAGPPRGLEAEPGQVPAKVGGEIAGKGEIQTTPAEGLRVGDTFVDDKGEPRRIAEIEGQTIKTADGTLRDYKEGEIEHQGELNSPRAQLARGGMFHPAEEGTEIQGEKPEIEAPEEKPPQKEIPEDAEREKYIASQPDRAQAEEQWDEMSARERAAAVDFYQLKPEGPRTEPVQTAEKAIEAIKERVKDQTHEGKERDYKVYPKGELDPNKIYATTFLLDDGSALLGDKGIQSHMQLAKEIGQHHLNDANAIRMVAPDSYELHGMPSEEQLAEMNRWHRGLQLENRQNVHDAGHMYWDFYPEDVKGYSADAHSEQHETNSGSPSDFRRAIEEYYGKEEEAGAGGFKPDDVRISTRTPTALRATENPHTTPLAIDMDSVRNAQGLTEKLADVVKQYPDLAKAMKGAKTPAERLSRFVDHIADNLEWLHNQMPPEIREITRKWYDSANKMAKDLAEEHGIDHKQTSGVMAALSPQKDWNMNVSLAKRVIETMKNQGDTVTSPEMLAKGKELTAEGANAAMKSVIKNLKGKTLDQITDPYEKAAWIRLYDEAHNPRSYEEIAPDGRIMGNAKTIKGVDAKVAWGDLGSIEKAVNIMLDGSRENISNQLGAMHKVRNFYNNIVDPMSEHPDVTIDTHAVAAGHIQPFSGNSHEVSMNFGGPSSALTGSNGTYPLYAEAYRKAAAKLGLKPRELQSIVWEQVRDLFPAEWKTAANAKKVAGVWGEYGKGKLTLDAARKQIVDLAGGFKKPEWFEKR
jgi:hypothetical protein